MRPSARRTTAIAVFPLVGLAGISFAQTSAVWKGGVGNWSDATKWSPQTVPNDGSPAGATYAVRVDNNPAVTARVSLSFSNSYRISSLVIDSGDEVRLGTHTSELTLGQLTNAGTLTLASSSGPSKLFLKAAAFTVGGGGNIAMTGGTITPATASGSITLTIADQTIAGYGRIENVPLLNQGTIRANGGTNVLTLDLVRISNATLLEADGGALYINASSLTNQGTIAARNGGTVSISANTDFLQSATGQLLADGGKVNLFRSYVNTRADAVAARNGGMVAFVGAVTNTGQILLADGGILGFSPNIVDNRSGTIRAQGTGGLAFSGALIDNRLGRIELAGSATAVATVFGGPAVTFNNAGGTIQLSDSAHFTFGDYSAITGGTLASAGSASFETKASYYYSRPNLADMTIAGTFNASGHVGLSGTIRNDGTFNVRPSANVYINSGQVELTGGGTVNISGTISNSPDNTGSAKLINRSNTLLGNGGTIKMLENHALVRSDIFLRLNTVFNDIDGTLRVPSGGAMLIDSLTGGGAVDVQNGGSLTITGPSTVPSMQNAGSLLVYNPGPVMVDDLHGGGNLWVRDFGVLTVRHLDASQVKLEWPATLRLLPASQAGAPLAGRMQGLELIGAGNPVLDLADRGVVVDYDPASVSPLTDLSAKAGVAYRYIYGAWKDGPLTSSNAAANPGDFAVGLGEASALLGLSGLQTGKFMGQSVDATTVLIRTTLRGDANLDGAVTFPDLVTLAQNYGKAGQTWSSGDFNYDGVVDFSDLVSLAQHYGSQFPVPSSVASAPVEFFQDWPLAVDQAPEPGSLLLAAIGMAGMVRRRFPRRR